MKKSEYKKYIGYGRTVKSNGARYYCHRDYFCDMDARKCVPWEKINSWGAAMIHELFKDKDAIVFGVPGN